ncbi:uncharacterized protein LOC125611335 [Marmota marmota marmota]|uniref:uncharacterized protein LOC125611335 n=1 Tax=Marmota marmota marmota TaxID=9994 RepID=UPI002093C8E1|nr:uncharacterized protein LOC125611335 [Marmota marmota marmota]XP_048641839.1 uncharacterized protein LOC125611335 [Marmota marmota marmota]
MVECRRGHFPDRELTRKYLSGGAHPRGVLPEICVDAASCSRGVGLSLDLALEPTSSCPGGGVPPSLLYLISPSHADAAVFVPGQGMGLGGSCGFALGRKGSPWGPSRHLEGRETPQCGRRQEPGILGTQQGSGPPRASARPAGDHPRGLEPSTSVALWAHGRIGMHGQGCSLSLCPGEQGQAARPQGESTVEVVLRSPASSAVALLLLWAVSSPPLDGPQAIAVQFLSRGPLGPCGIRPRWWQGGLGASRHCQVPRLWGAGRTSTGKGGVVISQLPWARLKEVTPKPLVQTSWDGAGPERRPPGPSDLGSGPCRCVAWGSSRTQDLGCHLSGKSGMASWAAAPRAESTCPLGPGCFPLQPGSGALPAAGCVPHFPQHSDCNVCGLDFVVPPWAALSSVSRDLLVVGL